jgi:hypothetical protein
VLLPQGARRSERAHRAGHWAISTSASQCSGLNSVRDGLRRVSYRFKSAGSLVMFAAMRRASSIVSSFTVFASVGGD